MTRTIDNKELLYIEGNIEESIKKIIKDLDLSIIKITEIPEIKGMTTSSIKNLLLYIKYHENFSIYKELLLEFENERKK